MYELVLSFEKDDIEMIQALENEFGNSVRYEENKGFNGLEILITAVIPIAAFSLQTIEFLLTHLHKKNDVNKDKKRLLVSTDGSINLEGYSEEEARQILKYYFELKNDKS